MSTSSTPATAAPYVVEDRRGALQVLSDGTVIRNPPPPFPASADEYDDGRVEWKDAVCDADRGLGLRMYRPTMAGEEERKKLPVLVYFHGGGFCNGSYSWPNQHAGCLRLAAGLPAVVLSFDYRLAPKHHLPAAQEDAAAALIWLRGHLVSDPFLADAADSRRVFVSAESAGGNMSHHLALQFGTAGLDPGKIAGYILLMPAFLSEEPSQSELDTPDTAFLNRGMIDQVIRLCLPAGGSKDDPLLNPGAQPAATLHGSSWLRRDERFGKEEHYEWFKDFSHLLRCVLRCAVQVLEVGCGNSQLGETVLDDVGSRGGRSGGCRHCARRVAEQTSKRGQLPVCA